MKKRTEQLKKVLIWGGFIRCITVYMVTFLTDFGAYYKNVGNLCMVLSFIIIDLLNIIQYYSVYMSILDLIRKKKNNPNKKTGLP